MDEELTEGYSEPCGQCGSVCWGITDAEQFFCKNCHNVIERTKEVVDSSTYSVNNRISSLSSGARKRNRTEHGREWMVCEGFQFILKYQAEALVGLGVCPEFKKNVLWNFWMRYLQRTKQAYTKTPLRTSRNLGDLSSDSEPESLALNESSESSLPSKVSLEAEGSGYSSDGKSSVCSGSLDAAYYFFAKERRGRHLMSMPRTLALCHLALVWLREAITLADLLRLVSKRHVPYINVHEHFPEEMMFYGRDAKLFRVESVPSYRKVHREALLLAKVMELPTFPPVSHDCLLHPALLSLRYIMDTNLPNELHALVCKVIEKTAMGRDLLTFHPVGSKLRLPRYDLQAAALIIVTLKLLFKLDDQTEWVLSRKAADKGREKDQEKRKTTGSKMFSLRRWYMSVQRALERAREREKQAEARHVWKSNKPVIPTMKHKTVVLKRRREVEQLQDHFQNLTGSSPEQPTPPPPSSFIFRWGAEGDADGPSLHHKRLSFLLEKKGKAQCLVNRKYWHPALRACHQRECREHLWEQEASFPRMYMWLLELFSFLLGVNEEQLHTEVIQVERRLLRTKAREPRRRFRRKTSM